MGVKANSNPPVLTIAGSDPSGGAGIQADLKTFSSFGVYGMTAITCLTIGNTEGVTGVEPMDANFVHRQVKSVVDDIPPTAVKTGMLWSDEIISTVAGQLEEVSCPVVIDPVMVTKRGDILLSKKEIKFYRSHLLPLADVVTPNVPEAELLIGEKITNIRDMEESAKAIFNMGSKAVIIKSGHLMNGTIPMICCSTAVILSGLNQSVLIQSILTVRGMLFQLP